MNERNHATRRWSRTAWPTASVALAMTLAACQDVAAPTGSSLRVPVQSAQASKEPGASVKDQYIVVFNDDVSDVKGRANALLKAHGGELLDTYSHAIRGFSAHLSQQVAEDLQDDPSVASVEQDVEAVLAGTQTNAPWGLDRIDQASSTLDGIYNYPSTGAGVNVYILDSGIRHTHTQFGGRVATGTTVVNDGYGPDGCAPHGTHVAGIVGGSTWGSAKGVTLYSVRVTDCAGMTTLSNLIAGVDWVTANAVRPAVANMSLTSVLSDALNTAVTNSMATGVTYVSAAGNSNADACNYSPAGVPGVITVGAIGGLDARASYSNYGSCVDLFAPGTQIYSANNIDDTGYILDSGTSQAAAFVSGAAAMYLQANPNASPDQVQQALVSGATLNVVTGISADTPNRLLRISGNGGDTTPPPPPPPTNAAPTAAFTASCAKTACSFDGSSSRDDHGVVNYSWSFGDGQSSSSSTATVKHTYSGKGNFSVTAVLTVTDAGGLKSSAQKIISIKAGK